MSRSKIREMHRIQHALYQSTLLKVLKHHYVCNGDDQQKLNMKLRFLRFLKEQLKKAFRFNNYQAEFVKNEAMKRVLKHSPESILVYHDTKKAEKLVRASFVLGHHYFRFIASMFKE